MPVTREAVMKVLATIMDPEINRPITDLGMVKDVQIRGDEVTVVVALTISGCPLKVVIEEEVRTRLEGLDGVRRARVQLTTMTEDERKALFEKLHGKAEAKSRVLEGGSPTRIIGVISGKGGVGKSTVTANLAAALAGLGYDVGVMDADIYGYSMPRMLGASGHPTVIDNAILPIPAHGLKVMSMGFLVEEDKPVIWRGPMLHKALEQFFADVVWADPAFLVIDLPPGTGDLALSFMQLAPRAEMLIVTTPQPTAFKVAYRAGEMARRTKTRVLGIVENMAYYRCDHCREPNYVFGRGGGDELSKQLGVPLLGRIPLDPAINEGADTGRPVAIYDKDSEAGRVFGEIAARVVAAGSAAWQAAHRPKVAVGD